MKNILKLLKKELRIISKSWVKTTTFAVVLILPLIYGALYLWAFWNPYEKTNEIPVAIVNMDQGITGTEVNYGKDLVTTIKETDLLNLNEEDNIENANDKLEDKDYYSVIIIPENFSASIMSAQTEKPQQAELIFKSREASNFIAKQITLNITSGVKEALNQKIIASSWQQTMEGISDNSTDLKNATDKLLVLNQCSSNLTSPECIVLKSLNTQASAGTIDMESAQTQAKINILSNPVIIKEDSIALVENYGTGFSAYFIPLALWVGSMAIFFLIDPFKKVIKTLPAKKWQILVSKSIIISGIGLLQAVILNLVLIYGLGLNVENQGLFFLLTILASITFVFIQEVLTGFFKDAGKFFGILILMLQLTSGAGTYPIETAPKFFQFMHSLLPMTYVINGIRETISGNNMEIFWNQIMVLILFLILTIGILFGGFYLKKEKK